jgi:NitT/TauT family transport system permease protein
MKKVLLYLLSVGIILLIWQLYVVIFDNVIIPTPLEVLNRFIFLMSSSNTYLIILNSFFRLIIALLFAIFFGIAFGVLAGLYPTFSRILNFPVTSLRTLPVASVIIIILILFGNVFSIYVITFLMIFPIVYEASKQGILNISDVHRSALKLEKTTLWFALFRVYIPLAMPYIITGILQSIGLGLKVLVMAEFIAQSPQSIGQALYIGKIYLDHVDIFAWTIILIIIVIIIETLVKKINIEKTAW